MENLHGDAPQVDNVKRVQNMNHISLDLSNVLQQTVDKD
jgi:hypothetical protein